MTQNTNHEGSLPRKGSVMYNFMHDTNAKQKKTAKRFNTMNKYFVTPLYRLNILPLFFIGRIIALLYLKGRKSGKLRIVPVEYRRRNGKLLLFSSRGKSGDWYKNIVTNPNDVMIKLGFKKYKPDIQISTLDEKKDILKWYMECYPKAAKELFGYQKGVDAISNESIQNLANFIEIFQLTL